MARIAGMFPFRRDRGEDTELFLLLDAAQKPLHAFRIVLPGNTAASPAGCCTVSVTGL